MASATLNLPTTHEGVRQTWSGSDLDYHAKLAQFVQPVETTEAQVAEILSRLQPTSGRVVLLLGKTGTGKSTFVESLAWRKHLGFARLKSIDCSELEQSSVLDELVGALQRISGEARTQAGRTAVAIDYLESLGGRDTQAFFQALNGILRKSPIFIVWPVTRVEDAEDMLSKARVVSGTIFDKQLPMLNFPGPDTDYYPAIATNTISVFNDGKLLQEFFLTPAALDDLRNDLIDDQETETSIREYLERVREYWSRESGHLDRLRERLPKPNEIWTVFCHDKAEDLVGQFATKGKHIGSAWKAYHSKLWEYVPGTKREGRWDSTRLQYAIEGAFIARVMHMSPQSVVSAVMAYGNDQLASLKLDAPVGWSKKEAAKRHMQTTALYRQLMGETPARGKTKGGPAAKARSEALLPFAQLNEYLAGSGRDRHVNRAIGAVLQDVLPKEYSVVAETPHPWIPGIVPDIRVDVPDGRQICIELCYTNKADDVWRVPDYVLDKLASYMDQIDVYVGA